MSGWDFFAFVIFALRAATWLLLVGFGFWVYRRLRLRSLPWLVAYAALVFPLRQVTPLLFREGLNPGAPAGWSLGEFMVLCSYAQILLESLSGLLVVIRVAGDVDGLIR